MKRILAIALALVMVLSMIPTAWAADVAGHTATHTDVAANAEWKPFSEQLFATGGEMTGGNYYLDKNITLSSTLKLTTSTTVNICLNGKMLNGNGKQVISVEKGTVKIHDCPGESEYFFMKKDAAAWERSDTKEGAEVIKGGIITGAKGAPAIHSKSNFHMYGGTVIGNQSGTGTQTAGGIFIRSGTAVLNGCAVIGNRCNYGGTDGTQAGSGIYVYHSGSNVTMKNCTVIGNSNRNNKGGDITFRNGASYTIEGTNTVGEMTVHKTSYTIKGQFNGNIWCDALSHLTVAGTVNGNVTNIRNSSVTVNQGAFINGTMTVSYNGYDPNSPTGTVNGTVKDLVVERGTATVNKGGTVTGTVTVVQHKNDTAPNTNASIHGTTGEVIVKAGTTNVSADAIVTNGVTVTGGNVTNFSNANVTVDTAKMVNGSAVNSEDVFIVRSTATSAILANANVKMAKTMDIIVNGVTMVFDEEATEAVQTGVGNYDVVVEVNQVPGGLTQTQSGHMAGKDVKAVYDITLKANGVPIYTADGTHGGELKVSIPYTKANADKCVEMYWVTDTGAEKIASAAFESGKMKATLSHLSTYAIVETAHAGGSATCQVQKICQTCRQPYGDLDAHNWDNDYTVSEDTHWRDCLTNGCAEKTNAGEHVYSDDCDPSCNVCTFDRNITHNWSDDYTVDSDTHWHACLTPGCQVVNGVAPHDYDNACDADCNVCNTPRTPADHVYDNACDAACNVCDAERTVGEHVSTGDNVATYRKMAVCDICGEKYGTVKRRPSRSSSDTLESPRTFDAGIAVYGMMALASAAGAAYVTKKYH